MSVRRAQEEISSAEFAEWIAYDRLEPIGDRRSDYQAAVIAYVTAQCHSSKRLDPAEFLKMFEFGPNRPASADDIASKLKAFTIAKGGTVKKGKKVIYGPDRKPARKSRTE